MAVVNKVLNFKTQGTFPTSQGLCWIKLCQIQVC